MGSGSQFRPGERNVASSDGILEMSSMFPFALQKDWKTFRVSGRILLCSVRRVPCILVVWSWHCYVECSDLYRNIGRRVLFRCWFKF